MLLVVLAPELGAHRHVQRTGQPQLDLARDVQVRDELVELERSGVERGLVRRDVRTEGHVQGVGDVEVELVVPVLGRDVPEPGSGDDAANSGRARVVHDLRLDQRQESERVDAAASSAAGSRGGSSRRERRRAGSRRRRGRSWWTRASFRGIEPLTQPRCPVSSASPQCVFGCSTALLPASPATIWSRGSFAGAVGRIRARGTRRREVQASRGRALPPASALASNISPSECVVDPPCRPTSSGDAPDFRTMLMTPAIASEPYCAAAPSRRTSIRSIARPGWRSGRHRWSRGRSSR